MSLASSSSRLRVLSRHAAASLFSLGVLGAPAALGGQAPSAEGAAGNVAAATDLYQAAQRAVAAEQAGNAAGYRREVERIAALAPGHPAARLYMARARAMTGDTAGALAALETVVPLGSAPNRGRRGSA